MNSIKTKGIIFSISLILLAISALGLISYNRFKNILVKEINNTVVRIANESADNLSYFVEHYVSPLIEISQYEHIKDMNWAKQRDILSAQINPYYLNVAVVDLDGNARYIDETILELGDRNYVKEALLGKVSFSEIIVSRKTGEHVIMVGVPIYNDNFVQGALIARLDVDFLSDFALTRGYGEKGRAYIISEEGTFISRPYHEKEEKAYNLYEIAILDKRYESLSNFVRESHTKQEGYGRYVFDDNQILMGYASVAETNWKIYIGTYEKEALESLISLKRIFVFGMLFALLISSIAAWIYVDRFMKPIVELDNLFSKGAQGDLTIRFTPKSRDEIGRLGLSFNRMMDKIKTLTQYDPLTLLLNQYVLEKEVETIIHCESKHNFSLIMIAIDNFSSINETYGYSSGDAVLCEVASRILHCISEDYTVYRYKGDEFVVLSNKVPVEEDIYREAHKILTAVKENYQVKGKIVEININIGVFTRNDSTRFDDPLQAVTHAKNYAKYLGGNQIQKFDPKILDKILIKRGLQADIIHGLEAEQFFLVYQPLFYLNSEKMVEIEALIRWKHPEKGLLYPDQFIEIAEQSSSIINIDMWVLKTACNQLKIWNETKIKPIMISVNISSKTFETKQFIPYLIKLIRDYAIDPTLLQLEITERMVINNVEESINKLKEVRAMGIRIAIDDFGIGYSSLSYIVRLPIDSIKIDKSFVQNIVTSSEAKAIVSTIINLCKKLKLNVIAEGIESKKELDYLRSNKCNIGQGYYFSKPVSIDEIEQSMITQSDYKRNSV